MDTAMLIGSFIPLLAILMGGLIILIPVAGLTARVALKPAVEAIVRLRAEQGQGQSIALLEQRLALVEQQLHLITASLDRLEEGAEFHRRLSSGS